MIWMVFKYVLFVAASILLLVLIIMVVVRGVARSIYEEKRRHFKLMIKGSGAAAEDPSDKLNN
jgi:hypothetical protein